MHTVATTVTDSEKKFDNDQLLVHKTASKHTNKLTMIVNVDGVAIEMEVDTGVELSTIPAAIYQKKLSYIELQPFTIQLHQYDGSTIRRG